MKYYIWKSSKEIVIKLINESFIESIIRDIFTSLVIIIILCSFYLNYKYCGDSIILKLMLACLLILYFSSNIPKKKETTTKQGLIDYINSLDEQDK